MSKMNSDSTFAMRQPEVAPSEMGTTGLREFSGVLYEEILLALRFPNATRVYREMSDNDPIIGASLFAIEMMIRQVDWTFTPASESSEDQEKADFCISLMDDMEKPWTEVINDILSFLPYGFAINELVYKRRYGSREDRRFDSKYSDGYFGWRKLPTRAQDTVSRWIFDEPVDGVSRGELRGFVQQPPNGGKDITIPIDKFLLFRVNSRKDNPESVSVLRNAYRPWFFKKRIEEYEAIGIERDLAGLPIAFIPPSYMSNDASPSDKQVYASIQNLVANVRNNEQAGIVFPMAYDETGNKLFDFKLLGQSGSGKNFDTQVVIQRYNSNIAQTMLADFILLGQQSVGSFALSSNKTKLFSTAIGAWLDTIAEVFNNQALPRLWDMNGWDKSSMPMLTYSDIEKQDPAILADYFSKLVSAGAIQPDVGLEDWLRGTVDAPEAAKDALLIPTTEELQLDPAAELPSDEV